MKNRKGSSDISAIVTLVIVVMMVLTLGIGSYCVVVPYYNVWEQGMAGQARLKESEGSRQIAIQEAKAKHESAKLLAEAEVERAKGVAQTNKIIGESS